MEYKSTHYLTFTIMQQKNIGKQTHKDKENYRVQVKVLRDSKSHKVVVGIN